MKGILTILTLMICLNVNATHWLTYHVYFETEYTQGTWTRMDILEKSEYKYLAPKVFEDLFGSEDIDLITTMISKLKEKNPKIYNWTYDLDVQNDTVIISPNGPVIQIETIKNEITATLVLNSFKAVTFNLKDGQETMTLEDLTLPFFDLVEIEGQKEITLKQITNTKTVISDSIGKKQNNESSNKKDNSLTIWLIISCIINVGLIIFLILKKVK